MSSIHRVVAITTIALFGDESRLSLLLQTSISPGENSQYFLCSVVFAADLRLEIRYCDHLRKEEQQDD
jgi:hypothetical protein